MISVAVCILITTGQPDTVSPTVSRKDEVELVPVLGPRVSPGHSVVKLSVGEGVGDAMTMKTAELQQTLSILVRLPDSKLTQAE